LACPPDSRLRTEAVVIGLAIDVVAVDVPIRIVVKAVVTDLAAHDILASTLVIVAVHVAVSVAVDAVVAVPFWDARRVTRAICVAAVDVTVPVVVHTVVTDLGHATHLPVAVGVITVDRAIAVVVDVVRAVLGAGRKSRAIGVRAIHGSIAVVVDQVIADFGGRGAGRVAIAVGVATVDVAIPVVIDVVGALLTDAVAEPNAVIIVTVHEGVAIVVDTVVADLG
jgi:hypothetical protein